jgi:protein SCO1/2
MNRRRCLGMLVGAAAWPLAARTAPSWHAYNVTGTSPALAFRMQATPDGRTVTEADVRGHLTLVYFGYTFCPDVCPLTLQNVAAAFAKLGDAAKDMRFLFVTVDPGRDTNAELGKYVSLFGPQFIGLRGSDNDLARMAKRYRIAYTVDPSPDPDKYQVTHSSVIYVFDKQGNARLLVPSLDQANADINGLAADLLRLSNETPSWWSWLRSMA